MDKIVRIVFSIFLTFVISLIIVGVMLFFLAFSASQQSGGDLGAIGIIVLAPALVTFLMAILTPFVYRKITNPSEVKLVPELYNRGSLKRILIYSLIGLAILIYLLKSSL